MDLNVSYELGQILEQEKALANKKEQLLKEGREKLINSILDQMDQFKISLKDISSQKVINAIKDKHIIFKANYLVGKETKEFVYYQGKKGKIPAALIELGKDKLLKIANDLPNKDEAKNWVNSLFDSKPAKTKS